MPDKINIDSTELLVNFKTAKNKREQINILADLHCCSPRTIAELLNTLGALEGTDIKPLEFTNQYEPVAPAPARPRIGGRKISFDEDVARRLFAEGVSTRDMAKALGVSQTAIQDWAKRRGLKREPPKGGPKAKKEKAMEQEKKFEKIVESVGAGKRCEPCEPTQPECGTCEPRPAANIKMVPRDEVPAVSPTCCQPGKAVDVWKDYRVPMPGERDEKPEPEEDKPFTLGELRAFLTGFLPAVLNEAVLYIDGSPVTGFYGFSVTQPNGVATVDLLTRRA